MLNEVSFTVSREDAETIGRIVDRAIELFKRERVTLDRLSLDMDLMAVHTNGCALDLAKLLAFLDFDFAHDIAGIMAHIDRRTGQLKDHFLPRSAR